MTAPQRRPTPELPSRVQRVHIIGICGTAMAALAGMLKQRGIAVSGSDAMAYPPVSDLLRDLGIPIRNGYSAEHVEDGPDLVVVGNVARRDNPEVVRTQELGIPYASLPEVLRLFFLADMRGLVITGTHGKTTTTSLVAWLLQAAGRDPSYLVGGVPLNFGSNYRLGRGDWFVLEGDEYDTAWFDKVPKFWHYPAFLATINNIEFDHADIYGSIDEIQRVFDRFAAQVDPAGALWVNGDDPRALQAATHARAAVKRFGLSPGLDLWARDLELSEAGARFVLMRGGVEIGQVVSPLWGEHNTRNLLGALAMVLEAGIELDAALAGLKTFMGVKKRQEIKGIADDIPVVDDFAHHPSAVRETLRAIRARYPRRRMWVAFEAKSNTTRRAIFQNDYPPAFDPADVVLLSAPWKQDNLPEAERISIPRLAEDIRARGKVVEEIPSVPDIVEHLAARVAPGDLVVGLSGSDFAGFHGLLLARLAGDR